MRLTSITVENYRSITRAYRVPISDMTVLVGPNNEGKSNVLRALVAAMNVLTGGRALWQGRGDTIRGRIAGHRHFYDWDTDFPIHLQEKKPSGQSTIMLDFQLDEEELVAFKKTIKSKLKDNLPIRVCLGEREFQVSVHKKGPGGPALTAKSAQIAEFVASRLEFEHVPAVRTAGSARDIVSTLVERELRKLEGNEDYIAALQRIEELQQPMLDQLSLSLKQTLVKFLPKVAGVTVGIPRSNRFRAMRTLCEVTVDDGTATLLEYKGDGVQSLAALALMRHVAETAAGGKHLVIAIEEPESHLHSSAVHEIRDVLRELAARHQVVITTHNALFVDRVRTSANILVQGRKAQPAKSIREIRDILGVRASDNLRHAELVLVAEGADDCAALTALLASASPKLRKALDDQTMALDSLNGATNLAYKLSLLRAAVCATHSVLDDDAAGHAAFKKAETEGLASYAETNFMTCPGRKEAELEDLYDPTLYASLLKNKYGVTVGGKSKSNRKFSQRMADVFKQQGKPWSDGVEADVKASIASCVATSPGSALLPQCRSAFDALVQALEDRLEQMHRSTTA